MDTEDRYSGPEDGSACQVLRRREKRRDHQEGESKRDRKLLFLLHINGIAANNLITTRLYAILTLILCIVLNENGN